MVSAPNANVRAHPCSACDLGWFSFRVFAFVGWIELSQLRSSLLMISYSVASMHHTPCATCIPCCLQPCQLSLSVTACPSYLTVLHAQSDVPTLQRSSTAFSQVPSL